MSHGQLSKALSFRKSRTHSSERFSSGNHVALRRAGKGLFDEMLLAITQARQFVALEMYWLAADSLGRKFFESLAASASRGVHVRVLYDSFGSFTTPEREFSLLAAAGASVIGFNPVSPLKERFHVQRLTSRNHRKLLITENGAYVGGANISSHWLEVEHGGEAWRDDVVHVRGPILQELSSCFDRSWEESGGRPSGSVLPAPARAGGMQVAVLAQSHHRRRRQAVRAYVSRFSSATESIYLSSAYFVPNRRIIGALVGARTRGVDVRIILPARSDVEITRIAGRATWSRLLRAGVRLYEWQPSVLHSKSGVVDAEWSTVGSFNLDYISVRNNSELNISVLDQSFAKTMIESFWADLDRCREVSAEEFARRSLPERVAERSLYWFRAWL